MATPAEPVGTEVVPGGAAGDGESPPPQADEQSYEDPGDVALDCDVVTTTIIGLDELSALGFAPSELLPLALGSRSLPMEWMSQARSSIDGALFDYAMPATGDLQSDVQIALELVGSQARQIVRFDSKYAVSCRTSIEVDARLTLTSADGALAARGNATLELGRGTLDSVVASASVPAAELRGGYTFDPPDVDGRLPTALSIVVEFTRYGQRGRVVQNYGEAPNATELARALWPVWGECAFWGNIPALDETVHPSAADMVEIVRAGTPLTLFNARGESAPVQLELTEVPQSTCFSDGTLSVATELSLSSAALPGPIRVPLYLVGELAQTDGQLAQLRLSAIAQPCGTNSYYSAQDFVSHCGDWGVDLSGLSSVFLEVSDSGFTPAGIEQRFRIQGVKLPGCTPSPNGFICPDSTSSVTWETVTLGEVQLFNE